MMPWANAVEQNGVTSNKIKPASINGVAKIVVNCFIGFQVNK